MLVMDPLFTSPRYFVVPAQGPGPFDVVDTQGKPLAPHQFKYICQSDDREIAEMICLSLNERTQ